MKKICLLLLLVCGLTYAQQPTLYLIGDSTMADKADPQENPEHGWGQMLPGLMTASIKVENHAVNGRSTRSFIDEGRWKKIVDSIKAGDFVIIQFGHNDQKIQDPARYTNPYTQYRHNLEKFVTDARQRGAYPILMSSIVRRNFNDKGVLEDTHGAYPMVVQQVAKDMNVAFVDLQWLTERLEIQYGAEKSKDLHLHIPKGKNKYVPNGKEDDTHLSEKGATLVAMLALQNIIDQNLPLKHFINAKALTQNILK